MAIAPGPGAGLGPLTRYRRRNLGLAPVTTQVPGGYGPAVPHAAVRHTPLDWDTTG